MTDIPKPLPSEPERCKCSGEVFDKGNGICGVCDKYFDFVTPPNKPIPPEPKCEHDKGNRWTIDDGFDGTMSYLKQNHPTCPFCKPVEPSVESIAKQIVYNFKDALLDCGYEEFELGSSLEYMIAEALRNERNRKWD